MPEFVRQALLCAVPTVSDYPAVEGSLELRQAAAAYLDARFGAALDPATQILADRRIRRRPSSPADGAGRSCDGPRR